MKIEFVKDKETKNAIRFTAIDYSLDVTGSLYISKNSKLAKDGSLVVEIVASQPAQPQPS